MSAKICLQRNRKEENKMSETLQKMISDGERIANLFEALTEGDKNIVLVYMSALRDKELADMDRAEKAG